MKASKEVFDKFCTDNGVKMGNLLKVPDKVEENTWRVTIYAGDNRERFTFHPGHDFHISDDDLRNVLFALCFNAFQGNNDYKDFLYEQNSMPDTPEAQDLYTLARSTRQSMLKLFGEDGFNRLWFDILYED